MTQLNYTIEDHYLVAIFSSACSIICIIISLCIIILIGLTRIGLNNIHHLLICNTCLASIFYSLVTINNYIYLIYIDWERSDQSCRWRAYFSYIGIAGVLHSYMIQAIARLIFFKYAFRFRWLITSKTHYILMLIQWFEVFLIVLPTVLTEDIKYIPKFLCWIPGERLLHIIYAFIAYYAIPILIIISIYIVIIYQIRKTKENLQNEMILLNNQKKEMRLVRNILILLIIYLSGGVPTMIAIEIPTNKIPYLTGLATQTLSVTLANLFTILLDRELRILVKRKFFPNRSIIPFNNQQNIQSNTQIRQQNNINPNVNNSVLCQLNLQQNQMTPIM